MAKNAASEEALGGLHSTVTKIFSRVLEGYLAKLDIAADQLANASNLEDDLVAELLSMNIEPSPAMLSAASKFLKDNEVTYDSEQLDELGALEKRLAEKKSNRPDFSNVTQLPLTGEA